jgi:hypothetical protein
MVWAGEDGALGDAEPDEDCSEEKADDSEHKPHGYSFRAA